MYCMNNQTILASLAMDLKRVALGLHRGSLTMADRFTKEAKIRIQETQTDLLAPYMKNILKNLDQVLLDTDNDRKAENALMYSTLIQNYTLKNIHV